MKLKNFLKVLDCNQKVSIMLNDRVVDHGNSYYIYMNSLYTSYNIIRVFYDSKSVLNIKISDNKFNIDIDCKK